MWCNKLFWIQRLFLFAFFHAPCTWCCIQYTFHVKYAYVDLISLVCTSPTTLRWRYSDNIYPKLVNWNWCRVVWFQSLERELSVCWFWVVCLHSCIAPHLLSVECKRRSELNNSNFTKVCQLLGRSDNSTTMWSDKLVTDSFRQRSLYRRRSIAIKWLIFVLTLEVDLSQLLPRDSRRREIICWQKTFIDAKTRNICYILC